MPHQTVGLLYGRLARHDPPTIKLDDSVRDQNEAFELGRSRKCRLFALGSAGYDEIDLRTWWMNKLFKALFNSLDNRNNR